MSEAHRVGDLLGLRRIRLQSGVPNPVHDRGMVNFGDAQCLAIPFQVHLEAQLLDIRILPEAVAFRNWRPVLALVALSPLVTVLKALMSRNSDTSFWFTQETITLFCHPDHWLFSNADELRFSTNELARVFVAPPLPLLGPDETFRKVDGGVDSSESSRQSRWVFFYAVDRQPE